MELDRDELKRRAAEWAVQYVRDGHTVGLGTGSTAAFAIRALGKLVSQGLKITGVPTSVESGRLAQELGIPLTNLNDVRRVDVTIDGADQIDPAFDMVKGGGGALTREKLVAHASEIEVVVIDNGKLVPRLGGDLTLPVEVLPFGWRLSERLLAELGCTPRLRDKTGPPFLTDNGNYILDCDFGLITDPPRLEKAIKLIPGVVECGLFIGLAHVLVIGQEEGVEIRERSDPAIA